MTIFDLVHNILFKKTRITIGELDEFVPFMIQRWITMHSPQAACIVNEVSNRRHQGIIDNQMWYDLLVTSLPKFPYKKLSYIKKGAKKATPKKKDEDDALAVWASLLQISQRELSEYIAKDPSIKDLFEDVEVFKKRPKKGS